MTIEKFESEVQTLEKFFTKFCNDKHQEQYIGKYHLVYKDTSYFQNISLCKDCHRLISYSFEKLKNCPHEEKPRCRKCPNPCYEKPQWKALAKLMRYGGIQTGIEKIINLIYVK